MKKLLMILPLALAVLTIGCGGPERPEGMPELFPASFKVVQEGQPVAGVTVNLFTDTHGFPVSGVSDEMGVVNLTTYNQDYQGAPVGEYRVTAYKVEITPSEYGEESPTEYSAAIKWMAQRQSEYRPSYDLVNPEYKNGGTTTLKLTVTENGVEPADLDLGPATRAEFIPQDSAPKPGMAPKEVEEE